MQVMSGGQFLQRTACLLGALFALSGCFVLYSMLDLHLDIPHAVPASSEKRLDDRLQKLDLDLQANRKTLKEIRDILVDMFGEKAGDHQPVNQTRSWMAPVPDVDGCQYARRAPSTPDVQMLDMYKTMSFDNPNGGAWKQGWDITYSQRQWNRRNKLKVFLVPHSHNDPGWRNTFEGYYQGYTRWILDHMVKKLQEDPARKFIWAEISFFALWWSEQGQDTREAVKRLVDNKQLEFVTGGWVMPDEANTHFYAILEQMIEGHQWLAHHLNYRPTTGWSIDPFGLSPTMAYLLKRMGMDNMVIQRVHYAVKKQLALRQNLEFRWRQMWDQSESTDMFCHMMPFSSYAAPYSCGPDPRVCCQFDFSRLPGGMYRCPWKDAPKPIDDNNVRERSLLLLDQYRKKSQLYRTQALLVPLGDDFRYSVESEWDLQFNNYKKLFDYMNQQDDFYVEAKFATLSDYFEAVREEVGSSGMDSYFPSLSGDFFTYADQNEDYWSGYFTSRPFNKGIERELEGYLRAAEVIYSITLADMALNTPTAPPVITSLMKHVVNARRNLGLFQHHDGITGTAREAVVVDYGEKMIGSIKNLQHVIQQCAHYLISPSNKKEYVAEEGTYFDLDDNRSDYFTPPEKTLMTFEEGGTSHRVVLYNPSERTRQEIVVLRVSTPRVTVVGSTGSSLPCQVNPVFLDGNEMSTDQYELVFLVQVSALSLQSVVVQYVGPESRVTDVATPAHVTFRDAPTAEATPFSTTKLTSGQRVQISNTRLKAEFDGNGLISSITTVDDNKTVPVRFSFVKYGAKNGWWRKLYIPREMSGAYLFLPNGEATTIHPANPNIRVVQGPLVSYVEVHLSHVKHRVLLHNTAGVDGAGLVIQNSVDIRGENNFELAMRISTSISNGGEWFSDLNGIQMVRRKTFDKLPLQANFYPMPTSAFIEDSEKRLTLLTAQPLGVAALQPGWIEVMQDRRLNQDDQRGLGESVTDNRLTSNRFILLLEHKNVGCRGPPPSHPGGFPSLLSHQALDNLLHPAYRLIWTGLQDDASPLPSYSPTGDDFPQDMQLVTLFPLLQPTPSSGDVLFPSGDTALVMRRLGHDCCFGPEWTNVAGKVNLSRVFPTLFSSKVRRMSLSLMFNGMVADKNIPLSAEPMEMYTYLLGSSQY